MTAAAARHPPLRVWVGASLLALIFLGAMARVDLAIPFRALRLAHGDDVLNLQRVDRAADDALRIVAIGSSKTFLALDYDEDFARRLRTADAQPVSFTRITWIAAAWRDLEPVLQRLRRRPPQVLLIESDLLAYDRRAPLPIRENLRQLGQLLRWWVTPAATGDRAEPEASRRRSAAFEDTLQLSRDYNLGRDLFNTPEQCAHDTSPEAIARFRASVGSRKPLDEAVTTRVLEQLAPLRQAGTRIVLLDLPSSLRARTLVAPTPQIDSHLRSLAPANGFELWTAPQPPESDYCDLGHVDAAGRATFSSWLATRLERLDPDGS